MTHTTRRRYNNPADALANRTRRDGDCFTWTGHRDHQGYGKMHANGHGQLAHRVAYELANGPIPAGLVIDHICHNTSCVNPDHLRAVTHKQNMEHQARAHRTSKSGVRGVYWNAQRRKWAGQVRHNGTSHYLGLFDTISDAAEAVRQKRLALFTHNDADREATAT